MRTILRFSAGFLALVLVTCVLAPVRADHASSGHGAPLVVIVSAANRTRTMSLSTVRDIFSGVRTDTPKGEPYVPLVHVWHSRLRGAFDRQFLQLEPEAVGRFWIDQRIRARVTMPRTVPSAELARRVVAALPSAISYVAADDLAPGVVPLRINGVDYANPAYPYHVGALGYLLPLAFDHALSDALAQQP